MDELANIYKEKSTIAYAAGFGIVAAAVFFLIFNMDLKNYKNIENTIVTVKNNSRILNEIDKYDKFIKEFGAAFAQTKSSNWIIDTITDNIRNLNIKLETIKPLEPYIISGFTIKRIQVSGNGDFKDVTRLINTLEHQKKYLFIEDVDLTPSTILADMNSSNFGRDATTTSAFPRRVSKFRLTVSGVNSE